MRRPAVVITAQRILDARPSVIQVVPRTSTLRSFHSEVVIEPDSTNGLEAERSANGKRRPELFEGARTPGRGAALATARTAPVPRLVAVDAGL